MGVKISLVRIGLGSAAIGAGALWFWPASLSGLDPEKGYTFVAAVAVWLFSEFYGGDTNKSVVINGTLGAHEIAAATRIFKLLSDDDVRFLETHDFGTSWREERLKGPFQLCYEYDGVSLEFDDLKIKELSEKARDSLGKFVRKIAGYSNQIGDKALFTLLSDDERVRDEWTKETERRVKEVNDLADETALAFKELYRAIRRRNVSLSEE